jgi:hypothetical protein
MTEAQWILSADVSRMMRFLQTRLSARQWRLFACARCRLAWGQLVDPRSRHAVEVAERLADDEADDGERQRALKQALTASVSVAAQGAAADGKAAAAAWADAAVSSHVAKAWRTALDALPPDKNERLEQARLLREIAGNPFRPVLFKPRWRTSGVLRLARQIYNTRRFERLPDLAKALEGAGCRSIDLLGHLRAPGPHVRGCWALDLILDRNAV